MALLIAGYVLIFLAGIFITDQLMPRWYAVAGLWLGIAAICLFFTSL